jgi:hypothetical protein
MWYRLMATLEDEDAQRSGVVTVLYTVDLEKVEPGYPDVMKYSYFIDAGLPHHSVAFHYCYNKASLRPAMTLFQLVSSGNVRIRFRGHYGKLTRRAIIFMSILNTSELSYPYLLQDHM